MLKCKCLELIVAFLRIFTWRFCDLIRPHFECVIHLRLYVLLVSAICDKRFWEFFCVIEYVRTSNVSLMEIVCENPWESRVYLREKIHCENRVGTSVNPTRIRVRVWIQWEYRKCDSHKFRASVRILGEPFVSRFTLGIPPTTCESNQPCWLNPRANHFVLILIPVDLL